MPAVKNINLLLHINTIVPLPVEKCLGVSVDFFMPPEAVALSLRIAAINTIFLTLSNNTRLHTSRIISKKVNVQTLYNPNTIDLHIESLKDSLNYYRNEINDLHLEEHSLTIKMLNIQDKLRAAFEAQLKIKEIIIHELNS